MPTDPSRVVAPGLGAALPRREPPTGGRPDPVRLAEEFLQRRLSKGPVLVSELEAAAQAAGLLPHGQRITHAKPFKRAKKVGSVLRHYPAVR